MKTLKQLAVLAAWCSTLLNAAPVQLFDETPAQMTLLSNGNTLIDFGRVAFGNLRIMHDGDPHQRITVHFGEDLKDGRVNRKPPGTVRYAKTEVELTEAAEYVIEPPADKRNTTHPKAVHTPEEWGVILPFRWVEIEGLKEPLATDQIIRQAAFPTTWDDHAASFKCSDPLLNEIWELCRYSIKATSFAGVYVDGDRERIPYEADAYLNQLSGYYTDHDFQMARDTFDLLMKQPTWPTEWAPHMVFIVRADWMQTGDLEWLADRYESLKSKTLIERAGGDGLILSNAQQIKRDDIVDWPPGERDGFIFTERNTVVNAFHIKAIRDMAGLAEVLGKREDQQHFLEVAQKAYEQFQVSFFNPQTGLYTDGASTEHSSLHSNMFPLALGIVPEAKRDTVLEWIQTRGMACSVYAAQYLMEALFENGAGEYAIEIMTANNDRSWKHMLESGTTITWEAWDHKYKPNQDWNHAWGAAPANLLPRFVLGVEALEPGWTTARIRPHTSGLNYANGKIPTPKGSILVSWENTDEFTLSLTLPDQVSAYLDLPAAPRTTVVYVDGQRVEASNSEDRWIVESPVSGTVEILVK